MRAAVEDVHHDCEAGRLKDGSAGAPLYAGEWVAVRVPNGVVVQVHDCDALEAVLPAVATNLARRGIEGSFDVYDDLAVVYPPPSAALLECRLRIRGKRLRCERQTYFWDADLAAYDAILAVAERWCRQDGDRAACSLRESVVVPLAVKRGEDVLDRMRTAAAENTPIVCRR